MGASLNYVTFGLNGNVTKINSINCDKVIEEINQPVQIYEQNQDMDGTPSSIKSRLSKGDLGIEGQIQYDG